MASGVEPAPVVLDAQLDAAADVADADANGRRHPSA